MAFCMNCGARLSDQDRFCSNCGSTLTASPPAPFPPTAPLPPDAVPVPESGPLRAASGAIPAQGYSPVAATPGFKAFASKKNQNALLLFLILSGIFLLGMLGVQAGIHNPAVLDFSTALGTAVVFILITFCVMRKKFANRNAHWDGVLESKRIRTKTDQDDTGPSHTYHYYELRFQTSTGRTYKVDVTKSAWEVFQPGDPVRKHRGYYVPERLYRIQGKSMCGFCSRLNDANLVNCENCKAPLLRS
jgi:hypothetical protein